MTQRRRSLFLAGFLVTLTLLTYLPTFQNDFVNFDDQIYVKENRFVAKGLTPASLLYAWTTFDLGNWIPLTWMSYELDAALFGIHPVPFHATNLAFHVANVLLLFALLKRQTGASAPSVVAAALFAVHPLHVESVAWIAERKDVLSTFWLLLALFAYERYALQPALARMVPVMVCFALGLLSKPMLVTLPLLLLLLDFWPLRRLSLAGQTESGRYPGRSGVSLVLEKLPMFAMSFVAGMIAIAAQSSGRSAVVKLEYLPIPARFANSINACGWYIQKTFWPSDLSPMYPHPMEAVLMTAVIVSGLVVIGVSLALILLRRSRPHLLVGWLWFLISLLPVIGLLQVGSQAYADRYTYVPHLGLLTVIVWEVAGWIRRLPCSTCVAAGLAGSVIAICAGLSFRQIGYWHDTETLWNHALAVDPSNYFAHYSLGAIDLRKHRTNAALRHFEQVVKTMPYHADALNNLGYIHYLRGERDLAVDYLAMALRANPGHSEAITNMERLQKELPASPEHDAAIGRVARTPSREAERRNQTGLGLVQQRLMKQALVEFEEAIQIDPDFASPHNNAALALTELGRLQEARQHLAEAIRIDPDNANAHINLAILFEADGKLKEAQEHLEIALRINPRDLESRLRLQRLTK